MDGLLVEQVGKALIKLQNKVCLVQQNGKGQEEDISFGIYQVRKGGETPLALLHPSDYDLKSFHRACQGLQTPQSTYQDPYDFDQIHVDDQCSETLIAEQLLSLTKDDIVAKDGGWRANCSMKILFMISTAALQSCLKEENIEPFLNEISRKFIELDFVELKNPFEEDRSTDTGMKAAALPKIVAACDTAAYYDLNVTCEDDLEFFFSYQCLKPILGSGTAEVCLHFHPQRSQHVKESLAHCVLSPLILSIDSCPERNNWVCPCHGIAASPAEEDSEQFLKCSVTHQYVQFEKSRSTFKLGRTFWEYKTADGPYSTLTPAANDSAGEVKMYVHHRLSTNYSYEALLFGMPFLLSPNILYDGQDSEAPIWHSLVSSLKERKECLLVSSNYDFNRRMMSITPLLYLLMPGGHSSRNMLLKRIASREELLTMEPSEAFSGVIDKSEQEVVHAMLDDLPVCEDITDVSIHIDDILSDLSRYMETKCTSSLQPQKSKPVNEGKIKYGKRTSTATKRTRFQAR